MTLIRQLLVLRRDNGRNPGFESDFMTRGHLEYDCREELNVKFNISTVSFNTSFNLYPTAFPYGNGMVLHFYQQQESSTTKTVHNVINKGLKTYV